MSDMPPGAVGTMMRTGRLGKSCATATPTCTINRTAASTMDKRRLVLMALAQNVDLEPAAGEQPVPRPVNQAADPAQVVTHQGAPPFAHMAGDQHGLDVAGMGIGHDG